MELLQAVLFFLLAMTCKAMLFPPDTDVISLQGSRFSMFEGGSVEVCIIPLSGNFSVQYNVTLTLNSPSLGGKSYFVLKWILDLRKWFKNT